MQQSLFQPREARVPMIAASCAIALLMMLGANARAADLTGNAAFTTDYIWRGSTQTQGDPAVQAGFKIAGSSGLYASAWMSNVKSAPAIHASTEQDFTIGWSKPVSDNWALDVNLLHYRYPATSVDLDWNEFNATALYLGDYWVSVGYSSEAMGNDASGLYTLAGARMRIDDRVRIEATVAHYSLDERVFDGKGYSHLQLSGIWTLRAPFELRVSAHATDAAAERFFGEDFAGNRVEAALQASF